jgi:tRNA threonylcarbamoyladenosine biosynthesis protein TsaB
MITLALDTSTPEGSVAVYAFGEMAYHRRFQAERSHSSELFVALEKARGYAGRFDRVAVGLGPGSYAGVRIGIAAAIGMNLILGAELVGIPSVCALETEEEDYFAIGDARRGSFYFTWIHRHTTQDGPRLANEREVREEIAARALPVYATAPVPAFPSVQIVRPSALILAEMAVEGIGIVQRETLEPLYLREPHITQPKATS